MPQMAPLMWATLFLIFLALLMFSMTKIYFSTPKSVVNTVTSKSSKTLNSLSWTW